MQKILHAINRFMPLLFWLLIAIITVLMLIELQPKKDSLPYVDKVEHAIVFIALTLTGSLAYPQQKQRLYAGLISLGALYEVLQALFTITRQASVYDWLADVVGIMLAIAISKLFYAFRV
jgi:VanZ family protein